MHVQTAARVLVAAPLEKVYALATDLENFHKYFKGSGPIPAVRRVVWRENLQPVPGAIRDVHNSDGSIIVEELLALVPLQRHRYRLVSGFKPPFSWWIDHAEGDWHFSRSGEEAGITWDYRFVLRSPLAWPVVSPIVHLFFRRAMQACLLAMKAELEGVNG